MNSVVTLPDSESGNTARYAQMVRSSKKTEWQIDRDLLQDRRFDFSRKFLPDGLSLVDRLGFLATAEARLLSQIQGRTYAYIFGLVERFISAKMLDQGRAHVFDNQLALEALVRFSNDEIKHQELFRRMETMMGSQLPAGYRQLADPMKWHARYWRPVPQKRLVRRNSVPSVMRVRSIRSIRPGIAS